ncbi:DUF4943 family protein [Algoriphagus antarcticus]|uniref:Uncharacterized protein DUF4943 n=1 Tax=Algoriphagus antarcticus TaxID=238540 RepID=A0A3E0DXK6_9BACT|nr:DUF4943 family protein [Algoriphagus antarcticus]REG88723.1 uncharacterized protein DUF4943 [Algoriphagus antarcticus]
MKTLKTLIACLFLISFLGCDTNEFAPSNMNVDRYVKLLKASKYDYSELPNFTYKDIPALLAYRNESQLIKDFPINMISSYMLSECTLGMYVLWTIESIRARAVASEYLIGTFPSQNPVVENKADFGWIEQSDQVRASIAQSYFDWWENNKNKDFDEFKDIDPLKVTEFRWH